METSHIPTSCRNADKSMKSVVETFANHMYKQFGARVFVLSATKDESDKIMVSL
jgi:hypothetical protein